MDEDIKVDRVVVDTSVVLSLIMPDEEPPEEIRTTFQRYLKGEVAFFAPPLLRLEVCNALRSAFLSKRVTKATVKELLKKFTGVPIEFVEVSLEDTLENSLEKGISAYDATFYTLAKSKNCKLLSLDKHLSNLA